MYQMINIMFSIINISKQDAHALIHVYKICCCIYKFIYIYITIAYTIIHCIKFNITEIMKTRKIFNYRHINYNKLIPYK